jgi:hypothetical protein
MKTAMLALALLGTLAVVSAGGEFPVPVSQLPSAQRCAADCEAK